MGGYESQKDEFGPLSKKIYIKIWHKKPWQFGSDTSATLVPVFAELCSRYLPHIKTFNIVDDSLIKNTIACGELTPANIKRVMAMPPQSRKRERILFYSHVPPLDRLLKKRRSCQLYLYYGWINPWLIRPSNWKKNRGHCNIVDHT